jgi:hypothetical protein
VSKRRKDGSIRVLDQPASMEGKESRRLFVFVFVRERESAVCAHFRVSPINKSGIDIYCAIS